MTRVSVYDYTAEDIERICDEQEVTAAELIEALIDLVREEEIDIRDWL